jgi:hypothetical protein
MFYFVTKSNGCSEKERRMRKNETQRMEPRNGWKKEEEEKEKEKKVL